MAGALGQAEGMVENPSTRLRTGKRGGGPSFDPGCRPAQDERPPRRRGGGPKTPEGKAAVRRNPIKHAVLAQTPVIPLVEREEDWRRLRDGVFEYFRVQGAMEEALADRIAGIIWRLYRVVRFESESINRYLHDVPKDWRLSERLSRRESRTEVTAEAVAEMDAMLMARLLPGDETLAKVMRYETRLHRFLLQSVHQLVLLKGLRKQGPGQQWGTPDLDPPGLPVTGRRHPRVLPPDALAPPEEG